MSIHITKTVHQVFANSKVPTPTAKGGTKNTMSTKISTTGFVCILAALCLSVLNVQTSSVNAATVNLGATNFVATAPFFVDGPIIAMDKGSGTFDFYHLRITNIDFKYNGTLANPFQTQVWSKGAEHQEGIVVSQPQTGTLYWNMNGKTPGSAYKWWGHWIYNIYQITSTEWICFCHIEKSPNPNWGPSNTVENFSIGMGYSTNGGDSWTFCGEIICNYQDKTGQNIGGCPTIIKNDGGVDYFYLYHNDHGWGISVSRSKVSDVITAARNLTTSTWKKYYNGAWNENSWGGNSTTLIDADCHSDICYNSALGKYLFVVNPWINPGTSEIALYQSSDGITWTDKLLVATTSTGEWLGYSWFAGASSVDGYTINGDCYVYWNIEGKSQISRRAITISGRTTTAPNISVKGNNVAISNGDNTPSLSDYTNFDSVLTTGATRDRAFKIFNSNGTAALTLSGNPKVALSGTNAADFSVTVQPASSVAINDSATFTIRFDPSAVGVRTATVSISNNSSTNPFTFAVSGTGKATTSIHNRLAVSHNQSYPVSVFNANGSFKGECYVDKSGYNSSVTSMPKGIYFLRATDGNREIAVKKSVVKSK